MGFYRGSGMSETLLVIISILLFLMLLLIVFYHYIFIKTNTSFYFKVTSILRKNALLTGKIGPEFRQYWFDHDTDGKPFSRYDFQSVMF